MSIFVDHKMLKHKFKEIKGVISDAQHGDKTSIPDAHHPQSHTHVEADITDLDHNAQKIKDKPVDITGRADNTILVYKTASDNYVHEAKPTGGGGAGITKIESFYDFGLAEESYTGV